LNKLSDGELVDDPIYLSRDVSPIPSEIVEPQSTDDQAEPKEEAHPEPEQEQETTANPSNKSEEALMPSPKEVQPQPQPQSELQEEQKQSKENPDSDSSYPIASFSSAEPLSQIFDEKYQALFAPIHQKMGEVRLFFFRSFSLIFLFLFSFWISKI